MSLSMEQEIALFEILQVPYSTSIEELQPEHNLTSVEWTADSAFRQAFSKIQDKLTVISANVPLETILKSHLDSWINLGSNVTNLESGGFDGINGIDDSPDRERNVIRAKVLTIVPFYRYHEEMVNPKDRTISMCIMR